MCFEVNLTIAPKFHQVGTEGFMLNLRLLTKSAQAMMVSIILREVGPCDDDDDDDDDDDGACVAEDKDPNVRPKKRTPTLILVGHSRFTNSR